MIRQPTASRPIVIRIGGTMRGKQVARVTSRGTYTPAKTVRTSMAVKMAAMGEVGAPCLSGPIGLSVEVVCQVPASWGRQKRALALAGGLLPTQKPDCSNMLKLIEDALNKVLWLDDAQITDVHVTKRYAEVAMTTLRVWCVASS